MHVLLVEDNEGDAHLILEMLGDADPIKTTLVDRLARAIEHVRTEVTDVVLLDLGLPDSQGLETLHRLRMAAPELPVVVLTGHADEESGRSALRDGAQDYLVKGSVTGAVLNRVLVFSTERQMYQVKVRSLFGNMVEGAFYQAADGTLLEANPAALDILGITAEEFRERTGVKPSWQTMREDGSPVPGDELPSRVALRTGQPVRNQMLGVFRADTSSYAWLRVNAIPEFKLGQQQPYQVFVTLHDVTDLKQAEERASLLAKRLSQMNALAIELAESLTVEETLKIIAERLRSLVGAVAASVSSYDERTRELVLQHLAMPSPQTTMPDAMLSLTRSLKGMRIPVSDAAMAQMLAEGTDSLDNLHDASLGVIPADTAAALKDALGVQSFDGLALVDGGELLGTAMLAMGKATQPLTREVRTTLARVCAVALQRAYALRAVRESESRFARIMANIQDAYILIDNDGIIVMASPSAARMYGYDSVDELLGVQALRLWVDDEDRLTVLDLIQRTGSVHDWICAARRKDGSKVWVSLNAQLHRDESGQVVGVEGLVRDVTEKRQLQASLAQSDRLATMGMLAAGVAHEINICFPTCFATCKAWRRTCP